MNDFVSIWYFLGESCTAIIGTYFSFHIPLLSKWLLWLYIVCVWVYILFSIYFHRNIHSWLLIVSNHALQQFQNVKSQSVMEIETHETAGIQKINGLNCNFTLLRCRCCCLARYMSCCFCANKQNTCMYTMECWIKLLFHITHCCIVSFVTAHFLVLSCLVVSDTHSLSREINETAKIWYNFNMIQFFFVFSLLFPMCSTVIQSKLHVLQ